MLILTGIDLSHNRIRVYDSEDDSNDVVAFTELLRLMDDVGRIYGLKKYEAGAFYPPDSKLIAKNGVVLIPSEAREAAKRLESTKKPKKSK